MSLSVCLWIQAFDGHFLSSHLLALKRAVVVMIVVALAAEAVKSSTLSLQSVHYVHCSDGLSLGVLGVGDSITDDVFQEHFQHPACLFVDQP